MRSDDQVEGEGEEEEEEFSLLYLLPLFRLFVCWAPSSSSSLPLSLSLAAAAVTFQFHERRSRQRRDPKMPSRYGPQNLSSNFQQQRGEFLLFKFNFFFFGGRHLLKLFPLEFPPSFFFLFFFPKGVFSSLPLAGG